MAGRLALALTTDEIESLKDYPDLQSRIQRWIDREHFFPRNNIAPRTRVPVIRRLAEAGYPDNDIGRPLVMHTMEWGFVPASSKTRSKYAMINARKEALEGAGDTVVWDKVKGRKRCVVVTQGYYKWLKTDDGHKTPYFVRYHDKHPMLLAGLYEMSSMEGLQDPLWTFSMVTTQASKDFEWLSGRQPVVLSDTTDINTWLDTSSAGWTESLAKLCEPRENSGTLFEFYPVPGEVGKVGNDSPAFVRHVSEREDGIEASFSKRIDAESPLKRRRDRSPGEDETPGGAKRARHEEAPPEDNGLANTIASGSLVQPNRATPPPNPEVNRSPRAPRHTPRTPRKAGPRKSPQKGAQEVDSKQPQITSFFSPGPKV